MRRRMQMVFQDPLSSLDPRQSVESILIEGLRAHDLDKGKESTNKRLRELLDGRRPAGARRCASTRTSSPAVSASASASRGRWHWSRT